MAGEGIMALPNTYSLVKEAICALLLEGAELQAAPSSIFCAPDAFEASTALPLALKISAELVAVRLNAQLKRRPALLYGAELVERAEACEGRLCFLLTDAFFDAAVREVNEAEPLPELSPRVESRAQYALARTLMLAKKPGEGCPKEARRMVWSALGIPEREHDKKATALRLTLAAEHALCFGADRPLKERMALYEKSGAAAACAARCIARGLDEPRLFGQGSAPDRKF